MTQPLKRRLLKPLGDYPTMEEALREAERLGLLDSDARGVRACS